MKKFGITYAIIGACRGRESPALTTFGSIVVSVDSNCYNHETVLFQKLDNAIRAEAATKSDDVTALAPMRIAWP